MRKVQIGNMRIEIKDLRHYDSAAGRGGCWGFDRDCNKPGIQCVSVQDAYDDAMFDIQLCDVCTTNAKVFAFREGKHIIEHVLEYEEYEIVLAVCGEHVRIHPDQYIGLGVNYSRESECDDCYDRSVNRA